MTMVGDINGFCCGCLSSDRKMKPVNDYWSDDLFLKMFSELQIDKMDAFSPHLCWECEARIHNFAKFKMQVKSCSTILREYINKNQSAIPQPFTKLTISNKELVNINIQNIKTDKITQNTGTGNSVIQLKHLGTQLDNSEKLLKNSNIQLENSYNQLKNSNIQQDDSENQLTNSDTRQNNSVEQLKTSSKQLKNLHTELDIVDTKQEVKEEDYSDDDRSLIDIRNEEKIRKKRVKKEKKEKVRKKNKLVMFEEITLTKDEIFEERVTLTAREDYINAMFKCEKCIVAYASHDDLKDHELAKHSLISKHSCEYCTRGFPSGGALAVHRRRHAVRWRCGICRFRTANVSSATNHYNTTHTGSEIFDMAAKAFGTYNDKIPESTEDSRPISSAQIPCQYCEKTFRWKTSLRKHLETHRIEAGHKRRPYCEPCEMAFTTTSNLRKHVKTSSKHQIQLKLRKLKESPASEGIPAGTQHIEDIKSSVNRQKEQYPCPQCEKKFQWKGNLWRHLRSHAAKAKGELVCTPCNRTFSSIATYNQHMKISRKHVSEDEFKYMCSDCGKRFSNKTKLRDHVDWEHLKNYTHKCATCQKVFKSHTSLYLHRQVVHRLYNAEHLCDHCGKSFPNKTKLRSHISALHTSESPYKCRWCGARFSWHSCLSRHARRLHRDKL